MPDAPQSAVIESLELERTDVDSLRLSGALNTETAQDELNRRLEDVHADIVGRKCASFRVDVRELSFVNSSAIRVFLNWISRAERAGYKLVFLTNRSTTWHRLSFSVLKSLAPSAVELVEDGSVDLDGDES
jgi:anti-anti-sigma regulatory factor